MAEAYAELIARVKDVGRLHAVEALLDWDQEVMMPQRGVEPRAEQMAVVAGIAHEQLTAPRVGELLEVAGDGIDPDSPEAANLREISRGYERATRLPTDLVKRITETSARAKDAWAQAREASDFASFAPHLATLVALKREVADRIGFEGERYDALLDEFEPGAKTAEIDRLFDDLGQATADLLRRIQASLHQPDATILTREYPVEQQRILSREVAQALQFDFQAGRADESVHPFCTTIGDARDVRITTRYEPEYLPGAMYGTMHEVGHGLYEQGLPSDYAGTPLGEAVSLGIHESQSRMWENMVGRSRAFVGRWLPRVRELFPHALGDVSEEDFYAAINHVTPSCTRVEADELTYNLHIVVRFQIERDLIDDRLKVTDVPQRWNERMQTLVGVTPASDKEGCLQDIHWSMGAFGYFPTYALGNLYAAQFFGSARRALPELDADIAAGRNEVLLGWLREHIHTHGQRYRASELVERASGAALSIQPFIDYATEKFSEIYRLD